MVIREAASGRIHQLAQGSIARPRWTLGLLMALVLLATPGIFRLELRTDGRALVPPDDPVVKLDAKVREHFGLRDPIVVLLETSHPDGVFNTATLRRLEALTESLAALPEIGAENVISLATERRDRVYPGTLSLMPYLDPFPESPELMALLRSDVDAARILTGTLVSTDRKALAVMVGVPGVPLDGSGWFDRAALYRSILSTVARFETKTDRIVVAGSPVAESLLGSHILGDLQLLIPLALLVITLVFWIGCGRLAAAFVALLKVAACLLWTFGLMGWLGYPVYLTTAILPVILTTICLADEIHILWHYQRWLASPEESGVHPGAVRKTLQQMARPVVLASLTTAIGFFSFLTSSLASVRTFGLFAGLGVLFCVLWSLTAVPAMLALVPPGWIRRRRPFAPPSQGRFFRSLSPLLHHRFATLAGLALVSLALAVGIGRLYVQDSWIDGFSPGSRFRKATARVDQQLLGSHILLVHLTLSPPAEKIPDIGFRKGPLLAPEALSAIGALEDFARAQPGVGGVLGPYSQLATVSYLFLQGRRGTFGVSDDPRRVDQAIKIFDLARGAKRRREVIDDDLRRAVVSIYLKNANYRQTAALFAALRAYERRHLLPQGTRIDFAGDVAVSEAMIPAIVKTQISSLSLALLGAFLTISILSRSLVVGVGVLFPSAVAILWTLGLMGWMGIPLGVATSMFCAITLGIGDDYAIHFIERFRAARAAGHDRPVSLAIEEAGPAIVTDSFAIALGFGLLVVSQVPANARLGLLVSFALLAGCVLTLIGLGALLPDRSRRSDTTVRSPLAASGKEVRPMH